LGIALLILMGLNIMQPFKVYPNGFPNELINEIETMTGLAVKQINIRVANLAIEQKA